MRGAIYSGTEWLGNWLVQTLGRIVHMILEGVCWGTVKVQAGLVFIFNFFLNLIDSGRLEHARTVNNQISELSELALIDKTNKFRSNVEKKGGWKPKHVDDVVHYYYAFVGIGWEPERAQEYMQELTGNAVSLVDVDDD